VKSKTTLRSFISETLRESLIDISNEIADVEDGAKSNSVTH